MTLSKTFFFFNFGTNVVVVYSCLSPKMCWIIVLGELVTWSLYTRCYQAALSSARPNAAAFLVTFSPVTVTDGTVVMVVRYAEDPYRWEVPTPTPYALGKQKMRNKLHLYRKGFVLLSSWYNPSCPKKGLFLSNPWKWKTSKYLNRWDCTSLCYHIGCSD